MTLTKRISYGLATIFVIIVMLWVMSGGIKSDSPRNKKLLECSDVRNKVNFQCPKGTTYRFAFGIPRQSETKISFVGTLSIYHKGKQINVVNFDSEKTREGNWLDSEGIDAYILGSTADSFASFDSHIKENEDYEIIVEFQKMPPHGTSLWLCYLVGVTFH